MTRLSLTYSWKQRPDEQGIATYLLFEYPLHRKNVRNIDLTKKGLRHFFVQFNQQETFRWKQRPDGEGIATPEQRHHWHIPYGQVRNIDLMNKGLRLNNT